MGMALERSGAAELVISFRRQTGSILAIIASVAIACPGKTLAQPMKGARLCPLPSTSEEILRTRLTITEYPNLAQLGPLSAWAMRAGHDALFDDWAKERKGIAEQGKTEFSLAPLTHWLALGRSSPPEAIRSDLTKTIDARPNPRVRYSAEPPPADHNAIAQKAVLPYFVLPSMLIHGRLTEAREFFPLSQYRAERFWHTNFLVNLGALEQAIELYRNETQRMSSDGTIRVITDGLLRHRGVETLAAFLDAELQHIRDYVQENRTHPKLAWYWQAPLLQQLSRLGRTDWEPPDPLRSSINLSAVASLISALRVAGRDEAAERHRRAVHEILEKKTAERKQRRETGKPDVTLFENPSPETFDIWIEFESAYALLVKGDLENAEKIVRPERQDRFARFSRAAVLNDLATRARQQKLWTKAEEYLTLASSEPLFPPNTVARVWLAAAADAQSAGENEVATRWGKIAEGTFCRLDPDRLDPHGGGRKAFVFPYLDSLYVLAAVREGRLPADAR